MNISIRSIALLLLFVLLSIFVSAQNFDRPNGFSGQILLIDHVSFQDDEDFNLGSLTTGFEFAYSRFLNKYFSIRVPFKAGLSRTGDDEFSPNRSFYGVDLTFQVTLFGNDSPVAPFIYGGLGGTKEEGNELFSQAPIGAGLNFRIGQWAFFQVKTEYRPDLDSDNDRQNLQYGFGLVAVVGPTQTTKEIEQMLSDTDGDGVDNDKDRCPDIAGRKQFGGCPDSDNDGIGDADDSCPDELGLKELNGCPDADADGIADIVDNCPNIPGTADGCPDADQDGIADMNDECPDLPGVAASSGCPEDPTDDTTDEAVALAEDEMIEEGIDEMTEKGAGVIAVDSDGDNFSDDVDECPNAAGSANGCPDKDGDGVADKDDTCPNKGGVLAGCPDKDGDGIADYLDTCPSVAGTSLNSGCPDLSGGTNNSNTYSYNSNTSSSSTVTESARSLMRDATESVQFRTLSDDLTGSSYDVLNEIANLLNSNPNYVLKVDGHTDNRGDDSVNQRLSEKRARACVRYLRDLGVPDSQMSYMGFGSRSPIADNDTDYGRSQNRRVEFELFTIN